MATVLPKEINYAQPASLPDGTQSNSIVTSPINGATFGPSQIVQFDLVQRGFMVPESMYIRYKLTTTLPGTAGPTNAIRGTPVYTMFSRLETIIGSQVVESIQNYNQLCNMLVNCKMNSAQKVGLATAFGYTSSANAQAYAFDLSTNSPNGFSWATSTAAAPVAPGGSIFLSAPLGCLLSNADNLIPLKYMPSCRIQLTTETLANAYRLDANAITNYSISNFELCYDIIEFSPLVDQAISSRAAGMLTIKSQSYLSSGTTLGVGSIGTLEFLFNQRLASIKSLFAHISGTATANSFFDSVDCTTTAAGLALGQGGDYQFFVSGNPLPARALSTIQNKSGILMELSSAFGPAHDLLSSNFSINPTEFGYVSNSTPTINQPGKFYVGVNTEKLSTNDALLTGISSQGSPISVRINIGTAITGNPLVLQLICLYDALIQIDMTQRTVVIMQ